jgi:sulfur-oxidizing protein SoxX
VRLSPVITIGSRPVMTLLLCSGMAGAQTLLPYSVQGDAIITPLTEQPGDAVRGRAIAVDRSKGACVLCHAIPESTQRFMGNVAPSLAGIGKRLSAGQLRLRIVDGTRVQPEMVMPAYYRVEGLHDVAASYRGKPVLAAQEVEDVIAYLQTLK